MSKSVCKFLAVLFIGNLEASSQKTIESILPLLEDFSSGKASEKATHIQSVLNAIKAADLSSMISPYRCSRICNILNNDLYDGVDYSAKALQAAGKFGYGSDPIGMTTVHSRLNEVMDLIVRSVLIDDIGSPTDSAMEEGGTIWSRLNYLVNQGITSLGSKDDLSLSGKTTNNVPFSAFLNFIRNQCVSLAGVLDANKLTQDLLTSKNSIQERLQDIDDPDAVSQCCEDLKAMYNILRAQIVEPSSPPEDSKTNTPSVSTYLLSNQYASTKAALQSLSETDLIDLGKISRISGYIWPKLIEEISDADDNKAKFLTGTFVQPGLTLMDCLNHIRQIVFENNIDAMTETNLKEQVELYPSIGLIDNSGNPLLKSGPLNKTSLHAAIKALAKAVPDDQKQEPFKTFFVDSDLDTDSIYNYNGLISCLLYPSLYPNGYKELFSEPLLQAFGYEEAQSTPWFLMANEAAAQEKATQHYIRKMLIDCAEFMQDEMNQTEGTETKTLYASLKQQFPVTSDFYDTTGPYFQLMEKSLSKMTSDIDPDEYRVPYDKANSENYPLDFCKVLEKVKKAETVNTACIAKKDELEPYEANKDTIEQFAVLAKNFEDACSAYDADKTEIKKSLISAQHTELKDFDMPTKIITNDAVSDYQNQLTNYLSAAENYIANLETNSTLADQTAFHNAEKAFLSDLYTKEAEFDFLLGSNKDHPADITLYGYLNGLLFECGAQLLINYIGTPCDCGDNNGTLYAKLRFLENNALCDDILNNEGNKADLIEGNANKIRTALGNLIGTIRYQYKKLICNQSNFSGVLDELNGLRSTQWTITEDNLTGNVDGFVTIIESLASSLLT